MVVLTTAYTGAAFDFIPASQTIFQSLISSMGARSGNEAPARASSRVGLQESLLASEYITKGACVQASAAHCVESARRAPGNWGWWPNLPRRRPTPLSLRNRSFPVIRRYVHLDEAPTRRTAWSLTRIAHRAIHGQVRAKFGKEAGAAIRILYGGSVKPDNIRSLMAQPEIDGALVGGASLDAVSFAGIVDF